MPDDPGFSHDLEIRDLGAKGCEIIVSVVNLLDEMLYVRGGVVEVTRDQRDLGRHRLSFDRHEGQPLELGQFEIAHGRFHLAPEGGIHDLHCRVELDCGRSHVGHDTRSISRRIKTGTYRRPG